MTEENTQNQDEIIGRQIFIPRRQWERAKSLAKTAENEPSRACFIRSMFKRALDIEEAKQRNGGVG